MEDSMKDDEVPPQMKALLHLADALGQDKFAKLSQMIIAQQTALIAIFRLLIDKDILDRGKATEAFERAKSGTDPKLAETHVLFDQFLRVLQPRSLQ